MARDDKSFVSRWSRLKRAGRDDDLPEQAPSPETPAAPPSGEPAAQSDPDAEAPDVQAIVESLPDIDSLTEESDFTVFLGKGVPEELKQRALRRLWRLNPVFANLDGLNDYDEDFTDAALVVKNLKTLYEVGKGMPAPKKPEPEDAEPETVAGDQAEADEPLEEGAEEQAEEQANPLEPPNEEPAAITSPAVPQDPERTRSPAAAAPVEKAPRGRAARRRWGQLDT